VPTPSRTKSRGTQWQTLGNGAAAEATGQRPKRHKPEPAKVKPEGVPLSNHANGAAQSVI
jgi:hypothetical protein